MMFTLTALSVVALANEVKKRSFFDSSFFQDETLRSAVEHFQNNLNDLSTLSLSMFKTEWQQDAKGRTLYVTPSEKNLKLDISIEKGMIQIKSAQEKSSENMRSQSVSSQMVSVPGDCNPDAAIISEMDDGLKIFFPYLEKAQKIIPSNSGKEKSERIPIKPTQPAIDI